MTDTENEDWLAKAIASGDLASRQQERLEEIRKQDIDTELRGFARAVFTRND